MQTAEAKGEALDNRGAGAACRVSTLEGAKNSTHFHRVEETYNQTTSPSTTALHCALSISLFHSTGSLLFFFLFLFLFFFSLLVAETSCARQPFADHQHHGGSFFEREDV